MKIPCQVFLPVPMQIERTAYFFTLPARQERKPCTKILHDSNSASHGLVTLSKPDGRLFKPSKKDSILIVDIDDWSSRTRLASPSLNGIGLG
jgi:hypothetical protein